MSTDEGVIKFQLDYTPADPLPAEAIAEINAWRKLLYMTELIGQDPTRYGGYGFGNISCRIGNEDAAENARAFVVTGTQTGHIDPLMPEHFTTVTAYYPGRNLLVGRGPVRPSSESLTHGTVYDQDPAIRWVMHAHSPELWQNAAPLDLPMTKADVLYGTPEMAAEVERLFRESDVRERCIFGMGGHEDGIVTFGQTAEEAGFVMLGMLARALALAS